MVIKYLTLSIITLCTILSSFAQVPNEARQVLEKLDSITLDHIEFEEQKLKTVLNYVSVRSRQLDPHKKGFNISFCPPQKEKTSPEESKNTNAKFEADEDEDDEEEIEEKYRIACIIADDIRLSDLMDYICYNQDLKGYMFENNIALAVKRSD